MKFQPSWLPPLEIGSARRCGRAAASTKHRERFGRSRRYSLHLGLSLQNDLLQQHPALVLRSRGQSAQLVVLPTVKPFDGCDS